MSWPTTFLPNWILRQRREIVGRERDRIGRPKYIIEGTVNDRRGMTAVVQLLETRQVLVIVTAYET
jgi:hypothetical protein